MAADRDLSPLLTATDGPVVEISGETGASDIVLICEHASRRIPRSLGRLGLDDAMARSHAAWDLGALDTARRLGRTLDAPLIAACFSRLVYDCNRAPEAPDAMPARGEAGEIPGNRNLSAAARQARIEQIYLPFREALAGLIDRRLALGKAVTLISVHSFTPVYHGRPRAVELGLLHDTDRRLADIALTLAPDLTGLRTARNDPYGPEDRVTHTLQVHALPRGLPNLMLEIRNDLLPAEADRARHAAAFARLIERCLSQLRGAGEAA